MLSRHVFAILLFGLLLGSGCGAPPTATSDPKSETQTAPSGTQTAASIPPAEQVAEKSPPRSDSAPDQATAPQLFSSPAPATQAEVTPADMAKTENLPTVEPTTAAAALAVIDLEKLPKPANAQLFDSQPTTIYFSTEGNIRSVDELTMKELTKAGWKETKHLVTSTDQYIDRLLTKEGYYLRLTISTGGSRNEIAVNVISLGNYDLRTLPQTKDAEPQESTPVMAGHRSSLSIPDAYDDLSQRMIEAGWQMVQEFQTPMVDVPHYRAVRFRKNAMRVNLGFVKDPAKPAEKINIFYHAESVMPIDLPMVDHRQPIKYDTIQNRAFIPFQGDRAAMVELLTQQAPGYGWQLLGADEFVQEKTSVMYLSVGSPVGIAARRVESGGNYYLSMERVKLPTKKDPDATEADANQLAQTNQAADDAAAQKMKSEIDAQFAQTEDAINKAVNNELAKALGSISGDGPKPDMQALLAQATQLQKQLGGSDESPTEAASKVPPKKVNIMEVPDDKEPIHPEDQAIKATEARIKLGNREYVLKHVLAYARIQDGSPTKIILLSDKPLLAEKLDKLCASGDSFMIYDGFGQDRPEASLELVISGNNVMMQLAAGGFSLSTNSSDIKSTVRLRDKKLQGRVTLAKPIEFRGESLTLEAKVAEKIRLRD